MFHYSMLEISTVKASHSVSLFSSVCYVIRRFSGAAILAPIYKLCGRVNLSNNVVFSYMHHMHIIYYCHFTKEYVPSVV